NRLVCRTRGRVSWVAAERSTPVLLYSWSPSLVLGFDRSIEFVGDGVLASNNFLASRFCRFSAAFIFLSVSRRRFSNVLRCFATEVLAFYENSGDDSGACAVGTRAGSCSPDNINHSAKQLRFARSGD